MDKITKALKQARLNRLAQQEMSGDHRPPQRSNVKNISLQTRLKNAVNLVERHECILKTGQTACACAKQNTGQNPECRVRVRDRSMTNTLMQD